MDTAKRISICGMLTALAMVFSYIDNLIPVFSMIPGMKLGLANIVILVTLYTLGTKEAVLINILRVSLSGMLFGNAQSFLFSLGGAILSLAIMIVIKRLQKNNDAAWTIRLSIVSETGALAHITGQLLVAGFFISRTVLLYYSLYMYFSSAVCGIIISLFAGIIIRVIRKNTFDMG